MYATDYITTDRPLSFIIIDDDKISNLVCKFTLLKQDKTLDIQLFTDPEIALAYIGGTIYLKTIVLLDINMPLMNGWEFLDEFSKLKDAICNQFTIYMLSSSIDPADTERSEKNVLVSAMFSKPLSPLALRFISEENCPKIA
jgi:CheY-like chemotaxis protein